MPASIQRGFLISRNSYDIGNTTRIELWLRGESQAVRLMIDNEKPVFFSSQSDHECIRSVLQKAGLPYESKELTLKRFDQQPVTAFYFLTIKGASKARYLLRQKGIGLFESDIRLHDRFLMERFVYGDMEFTGSATQKVGYLEVTEGQIRPVQFAPDFSVVSLDIECSYDGELYSIGLQGDHYEKVIMIGNPEPSEDWICWVKDEKALLSAFIDELSAVDPDIIIGWNVINFDCRLLVKRADYHQISLTIGRGNRSARWRDRKGEINQGFIDIPGRTVIDGIDALKAAIYHFDSFSLEFVAQALLGKGKQTEDVDNRMAAINHDFLHNKQKLARYNLEDCRLVSEVFEKTRLLDFLRLRSHLTGLELDRMGGSVQAFTNLYLPKLHRAGYIAPNLPEGGGLASPGGYVMNSIPGLYKNVLVLDFKSLYPAIIRTFRIDPLGLIEGLQNPQDAIPGFRGGLFSRDQHFLPEIITSLWQQRDEAKKEQDSARSHAIKILMNSFYGVLGSGGCRFYDTRLASSITMRGHSIMQTTAKWIEAEGHKVIYGDTDSTFVLLNDQLNHQQADAIGQSLVTMINQRWQETLTNDFNLDCFLELEYETHYCRFLMPTIRGSETGSKKRYAGLKQTDSGTEMVFKGLETVRSDWTTLAKEFQTELYQLVFNDLSPVDLIKKTVTETLAGKRDHQLVYRKRLRKKLKEYTKNIPPQVKAARRADELYLQQGKSARYANKGWINYLITTNGPEPIEFQTGNIDYQHYIEKQLQPVADAILPFTDYNFSQIVDDQLLLF
ncbi:DNA polymerase II [Endozoicomonas sp. OPT23]|uniref:DNA polymerase II n=1 Tax=Endozoicomonas sp. OPT23 TaxID=2072845 RepID=UPI00129BE7AD|nr:DNA polymerase II [Endozoicomonas sp. OPT23]MRI35168.1 DNA polymerase II [Endozoicomonas sp. OPT23]